MASRKNKNGDNGERKRKILGIGLVLLAVLILISLVSHSGWDDERIVSRDNPFAIDFKNQVGIVGAVSSYVLFFFFGWLCIFLPVFLMYWGFRFLNFEWRRLILPGLMFIASVCTLITMMTNVYLKHHATLELTHANANGGYVFYYLTMFIMKILGAAGSFVVLGAGIIVWLVILGYKYPFLRQRLAATDKQVSGIAGGLVHSLVAVKDWAIGMFSRKDTRDEDEDDTEDEDPGYAEIGASPRPRWRPESAAANKDDDPIEDLEREKSPNEGRRQKITLKKKPAATIGLETTDYKFPGLDLLTDNPEPGLSVSREELDFSARSLKETLETFGVSLQGDIDKYPGPVITRFEIKPAAGIKVHQITNLSDDLALALKAKRIRIVAPIPGKAKVGVEIPNRVPRMVYIKEILNSDEYRNPDLRLPIALGKTISGKPYATDLAKMPHLLIAGATGSGKSVCINVLITSLIYRLHPKELKFIFIDPKMLELTLYSNLPHMARPVVTNSKRAEKVLADAVVEMENRYKKLAAKAVRNIVDFNARLDKNEERLPYIVIVVDELADMMMASASSRIEVLITRLAQMARAVGIHLVLATQRPSVDVITGLIKANFPSRIAFQVASRIDSRTILDGNGAEKLLGNGDMLFLPPGQPEPMRLHGAYLSSEESERLVKFITDQFPTAAPPVDEKTEEEEEQDDALDLDDPVFMEAVEVVIRHKQGSVSLLQRKLGIGYQRAARLIDKLETAGVVSAYDGSKARKVLVDKTFLEKMTTSRSLGNSNS
jgi:S-DNA-T family DNA segregation ATPase FtsK/SpoIIIE